MSREINIEKIKDYTPGLNGFAREVEQGLLKTPKSLPCKYIYDDEGSRLFGEIMKLPEYYLTRCEAEILENTAGEIARTVGNNEFNLVELGSGDGSKTMILLDHFFGTGLDVTYVPIDICETAVRRLLADCRSRYGDLRTRGLVGDYFEGLDWLARSNGRPTLALFLGSNIGNFSPEEADGFLTRLGNSLTPGDFLLIGFDMQKDPQVLETAYNDSMGVTARFNKNILERINRDLRGSFDTERFEYQSRYNPHHGAVESFLVSRSNQRVSIDDLGRSFHFERWEAVHTESSYKYRPSQIRRMASNAGFLSIEEYSDSLEYFTSALWRLES